MSGRARLWLGAASLSVLYLVSACDGSPQATTEGGSAQTGGSGGTGGTSTGGTSTGGSTGGTGGAAEPIPDPGMVMGGEWTDVEPNDKPGQAVPVGILNGPVWMGFAEPFT